MAYLSDSNFDFYKDIEQYPEYFSAPLRNAHGDNMTGATRTLMDLINPNKNTLDRRWDADMFFRANGSRIPCGFNTKITFDVFTGMHNDGSRSVANCNDWTESTWRTGSELGTEEGNRYFGVVSSMFFDRSDQPSPPSISNGSVWQSCQSQRGQSVNDVAVMSWSGASFCTLPVDGLVCVECKGPHADCIQCDRSRQVQQNPQGIKSLQEKLDQLSRSIFFLDWDLRNIEALYSPLQLTEITFEVKDTLQFANEYTCPLETTYLDLWDCKQGLITERNEVVKKIEEMQDQQGGDPRCLGIQS